MLTLFTSKVKLQYCTFNPLRNLIISSLGSWKNTFDKRLTSKAQFFPTDGEQITVYMMKRRKPIEATFKVLDNFGAKVLKLPYTGNRISMILILPEQRYQLAAVTEKLKALGINKLMEEIEEVEQNNRTTSVRVFLPKFTCKKTLRLNGPLKQLGMTDMFSRRANFQMLADKRDKIKLSQVKKFDMYFHFPMNFVLAAAKDPAISL